MFASLPNQCLLATTLDREGCNTCTLRASDGLTRVVREWHQPPNGACFAGYWTGVAGIHSFLQQFVFRIVLVLDPVAAVTPRNDSGKLSEMALFCRLLVLVRELPILFFFLRCSSFILKQSCSLLSRFLIQFPRNDSGILLTFWWLSERGCRYFFSFLRTPS